MSGAEFPTQSQTPGGDPLAAKPNPFLQIPEARHGRTPSDSTVEPRHIRFPSASEVRVEITIGQTPPATPINRTVHVAAKSKSPRSASSSGVPQKGDPKLTKPVTAKKVGCWEGIKTCFLSCFPCCKSSRVAPAGQDPGIIVTPPGGRAAGTRVSPTRLIASPRAPPTPRTLESLEADAVKEITSKVIGGNGRMRDLTGQLIPWDYDGIAVELGFLPGASAIPMKRVGSSPGEIAVGNTVVKNYKTFAAALPPKNTDNPNDKRTALDQELVYRTIQLRELAGGGQEQGTDNAKDYYTALIACSENFDGDKREQLELLRNILEDPKFQARGIGTIAKPLYDAILDLLMDRKPEEA